MLCTWRSRMSILSFGEGLRRVPFALNSVFAAWSWISAKYEKWGTKKNCRPKGGSWLWNWMSHLKRCRLHYQMNAQRTNSLGQVMESWWDIQMSYLESLCDVLDEFIGMLVLQGGWIPRVLEKNITFRVSLSLISVVDVRLQYSSPKSASLYWSLNCSVSPNAVFISRTSWSTDTGILT